MTRRDEFWSQFLTIRITLLGSLLWDLISCPAISEMNIWYLNCSLSRIKQILLLSFLTTVFLGTEEKTQLQRHVESWEVVDTVELNLKNLMNSELAL